MAGGLTVRKEARISQQKTPSSREMRALVFFLVKDEVLGMELLRDLTVLDRLRPSASDGMRASASPPPSQLSQGGHSGDVIWTTPHSPPGAVSAGGAPPSGE